MQWYDLIKCHSEFIVDLSELMGKYRDFYQGTNVIK
ncbi:hypothetical protein SLEP1_g14646 [Rubroshorea leprosula]|uniref:Uncharacterized protein n=1 Tax=Rubroshorea leprosula TaxID=152421 RepID=A0AAV5IWE8_9ROSI|nr:hypothetical protein SLEP1_g14646 [Rubroshorea leprosula]